MCILHPPVNLACSKVAEVCGYIADWTPVSIVTQGCSHHLVTCLSDPLSRLITLSFFNIKRTGKASLLTILSLSLFLYAYHSSEAVGCFWMEWIHFSVITERRGQGRGDQSFLSVWEPFIWSLKVAFVSALKEIVIVSLSCMHATSLRWKFFCSLCCTFDPSTRTEETSNCIIFLCTLYSIAVNSQGRKLSQIRRKWEFRGEKCRGLLETNRRWVQHDPKFHRENFHGWLSNLKIQWKFSPSKVSHYMVLNWPHGWLCA